MIWTLLKHVKKSNAWVDPSAVSPVFLFLLDMIMENMPHGCVMKIHKGMRDAADFHIIGLDFLTVESLLINYLSTTKLIENLGLGLYPEWSDPGFHIRLKDQKCLWGKIGNEHVSYEDALIFAREKFKNG